MTLAGSIGFAQGASGTGERLVVIGNGMAGARLVEELLLRDPQRRLQIAVFGAEPRGNYNRILLSAVLGGTQAAEDIELNPLSWYRERGVRLHAGVPATRVDRAAQVVCGAGGVSELYDRLIFATGSTPVVPAIDGLFASSGGQSGAESNLNQNATDRPALKPGAFVFRTVEDCRRILAHAGRYRRAAVIGGGLLGLEAARGLAARGLEVHVVHAADYLMNAQLDPTAGQLLAKTMSQLGITFHLAARTSTVLGDEAVAGLALESGTSLPCEIVVLACGVRPNVALARRAGLTVSQAIVVDDQLRSPDDPRIYAIGECAEHRGRLYGLVQPGWEQARVLAEHLAGGCRETSYGGSKLATKLKVAGVEVATIGEAETRDGDEVVQYVEPSRGVYKKVIVRDGRLAGAILLGDATAAATLIQSYDRDLPLPEDRAHLLFPTLASGARGDSDPTSLPDSARVCTCNGVTKSEIVQCIAAGARTIQRVGECTRAGTGCGTCQLVIRALLTQPVLV